MITTINTSAHDLRGVPDCSVQAVITSPPYYGLRSYAGDQGIEWPTVVYRLNEFTEPVTVQGCEPGCAHEWVDGPVVATGRNDAETRNAWQAKVGLAKNTAKASSMGDRSATQGRYCLHCGGWRGPLGLEPSPVAYIGHLILCLREWRRVLRDDGCVFVNLGDSYAGSGGAGGDYSANGLRAGQPKWKSQFKAGDTVKPKDLLGIPWMFAFAARADGWWLRSEIIWAKPNPMPESVTDRPTKAHEQVFLLAKSSRYYWDAEAVREPLQQSTVERYQYGWNGDNDDNSNGARTGSAFQKMKNGETMGEAMGTNGRNIRTVWNIATRPYSGAHYAVFPPDLVEPMVLASTSARGCCSECGAPWERVVERTKGDNEAYDRPKRTAGMDSSTSTLSLSGNGSKEWAERGGKSITTGWRPTCDHTAEPVHCTVLDPFAGSGTTGMVAVKHRRAAILVDISEEYIEQHIEERTDGVQMRLGVLA